MTYQFPEFLHPLRDYLRGLGCDVTSFATARQAAFMAQQLIGSRIKFPTPGADMTSTLFLIQKVIPGVMPKSQEKSPNYLERAAKAVIAKPDLFGTSARGAQVAPGGKGKGSKPKPAYLTAFDPVGVKIGYHVFADGACVPNPGPGGWGIVVYKDGQEIHSDCGGEETATNNTMEITAVLKAIEWARQYPALAITIWSDSQYVVNGVNDWRHGWKRNGWQRGSDKAEPKNRHLANAGLWQAIDEALSGPRAAAIAINWIKGHAGHDGNERADELAEIGRQSSGNSGQVADDLDAEYRAVMAG